MAWQQRERCERDRKDRRVEETIGVVGWIDRVAVEHAMSGTIVNVEVALCAKCRRNAEPDEVNGDRDPRKLAGARRLDRLDSGKETGRAPRRGHALGVACSNSM